MLIVQINDEDARGNCYHSFRLKLEKSEISVEDLIKLRIESEIKRFNEMRPLCFYSLVQPENAEITIKGYRLKKHRNVDWQAQFQVATSAFEKKAFIISHSGKDYQMLEDIISLSEPSENHEFETIVFVRFMEMIGG